MLNEQLLRQWSAAHQGQAPDVNPEIVELSHTLRRQGVLEERYGIPASATDIVPAAQLRARLLRALVAAVITLSLFGAGVGVLVAPAHALTTTPHVIFE